MGTIRCAARSPEQIEVTDGTRTDACSASLPAPDGTRDDDLSAVGED